MFDRRRKPLRPFRSARRRTMSPGMRLLRILYRLGGLVIALVLLCLFAAGGALFLSMPAAHEAAAIPGLSAPVSVAFDGNGIPHIRAATAEDGAAAIGWVHARDRLFQMELMRRAASGQVSELAGARALPLDRMMRVLGLRVRAEEELATLPAETRSMLDAYARGVNAYVAAHGRWSAFQFAVLGRPAPWTPVDSLLWGKTMGMYLSGNWDYELERLSLSATVPRAMVDALWPPQDATPGPSASAAQPLFRRPGSRDPGRRAALPRPLHPAGNGLQRMGGGWGAQHDGGTAASGRSAPCLQHAGHLVSGADRHANGHAGWRDRAWRAVPGDRP